MLNRQKEFGAVYAWPGVHFEQDGNLFDNDGWQVDGKGNIIDPDFVPENETNDGLEEVEEKPEVTEEKPVVEPVNEPENEPDDELELIDRIKIIDSNMDGYIDADELKAMLDGYGRTYDHRYRRRGLLKMLKDELGL